MARSLRRTSLTTAVTRSQGSSPWRCLSSASRAAWTLCTREIKFHVPTLLPFPEPVGPTSPADPEPSYGVSVCMRSGVPYFRPRDKEEGESDSCHSSLGAPSPEHSLDREDKVPGGQDTMLDTGIESSLDSLEMDQGFDKRT